MGIISNASLTNKTGVNKTKTNIHNAHIIIYINQELKILIRILLCLIV